MGAVAAEAAGAHRGLRRLASRTAVTTGAGLAGRAMKLGLHLLISRSAGAHGYGQYTLGLNVTMLAQNLAIGGLDQTLVRFLPDCVARRDPAGAALVRAAWAFVTAASLLAGGALFAAAPPLAAGVFHDPSLAAGLRVFAASLVFFNWLALGSATLQGLQLPGRGALLQDVALPAAGAAGLLLLLRLGTSQAAATSFLAATAVVGVAAMAMALRHARRSFGAGRPERRGGRRWAAFAVQMLVIEAAAYGFTALGPVAVAVFEGVRESGVYSAALALVGQVNLLYAGMSLALPAMLVDLLVRGERGHAELLLQASMRWLTWLALPAGLLLAALGPLLLRLFGAGFAGGGPVVVALAAGQCAVVVTVFSGYALVQAGQQTLDACNHLALLGVALVAYPLAAHAGGTVGVAVATSLLNVALSATKVAQVQRRLGLRMLHRGLWRPLAAGAAMLLVYAGGRALGLGAGTAGGAAWTAVSLAVYCAAALPLIGEEDRPLARSLLAGLAARASYTRPK